MRLAAIALAGMLAAGVGTDVLAESGLKSIRTAPAKKTTPVRKATSPKKATVQGAQPIQREMEGRATGSTRGATPGATTTPQYGPAGGGQLGVGIQNPALTLECGMGFVKQIKPDHPAGLYECRLPAPSPCQSGYQYKELAADPNRLKYHCDGFTFWAMANDLNEEWAGDGEPQTCPPGWSPESGQKTTYHCASGNFSCRSGYRVSGHSVTGPKWNLVYRYGCRLE